MDRFVKWMIHNRIIIGVVLLTTGLGLSALLAFFASSKNPPDGAQSALLVVIGGAFNVGGAWTVSRHPGGPNLGASYLVIRHLANITRDVSELKRIAETAFESRQSGKGREDLGNLSSGLSEIEKRLIENVEDWALAYPDLIEHKLDNLAIAEKEKI